MTPYHESDGVTLYHGDCLQVLRTLPAESIDAVVSDPPYGLSFMGKRWDYDVPAVEVWAECLRVLKPGGHLLAFAGTRTQHRMAVRIEDAGFEIRDMIAWVYGSGFSKSFNLRRAEICNCSGNPIACAQPTKEGNYGKSEAEHNLRPLRESHLQAPECAAKECQQSLLAHVQQHAEGLGAVAYAGGDNQTLRKGSGQPESSVEGRSIHGTGQGLCSDSESEASASEAKRVRAGTHFGGGEDAGATAGGQRGSAPHQSQPSGQQAGESAGVQQPHGALDAGALRGRGACERCGKLKKEFEGFGTGLKPSHEPITVARKPLSGTVAENVLQHGTGALNVDGCRVPACGESLNGGAAVGSHGAHEGWRRPWMDDPEHSAAAADRAKAKVAHAENTGRWPANLIHDGSDEVAGLFPETGAARQAEMRFGKSNTNCYGNYSEGISVRGHNDAGGSAARFFYCAKASKRDRGETNRHPTVKPTALMRYLCKLVTPPGGLVLDPFTGSGSTGRGAVLEGFRFVGMELDAEHVAEAKRRILEVQNGWTDEPEDEPVEDLPGQRLLF